MLEPVLGDDGAILGVRVKCTEEACLEDERQRNQCVKSVCVCMWGGWYRLPSIMGAPAKVAMATASLGDAGQ